MPNLSSTKARTSTSTAWKNRDRRMFMRRSLEREEERHEVHVLLRRQARAEVLRHDAGRIVGHGAHAFRVEDLAHDVVRRLDLRDLRQIGPDWRPRHVTGLVAGQARALAHEHRLAELRIAGN